jgi:DNA-directed RNA polymerase specialized sigma24 family protein
MRRGSDEFDEQFTAFVRSRGEHHLRMATLLAGSSHAAEDLVQASLLKLYRRGPGSTRPSIRMPTCTGSS